MDNLNWLVLDLLTQQAIRERLRADRQAPNATAERGDGRGGVKRSLASTLVRLGLRLDPAAGEGLGAFDLSLARPKGAQHA